MIPPVADFDVPNPALDLDGSPFYIPRTARPWPAGDVPRRAGVTSLGLGGTNVHLILEEAPPPAPRTGDAPGPASCRCPAATPPRPRRERPRLARPTSWAAPQPIDLADLVTTAALGPRSQLVTGSAVRGSTPAEPWPGPRRAGSPEPGRASPRGPVAGA